MRMFFGVIGVGLFSFASGCQHVGGKCDQCAATPGDASLYAPLTNYQTPTAPAPVPVSSAPVGGAPKKEMPKTGSVPPMVEELSKPKEMPKR